MAISNKIHSFKVSNRRPGQIMTGLNTEVLMDGEVLKGCKSFSFDVNAKGVASIKIELFGEVEIDGDFTITSTNEISAEQE